MMILLLILSVAAYVTVMLCGGSLSRNLFRNTPDQLLFQLIRDGLCLLLMVLFFRAVFPSRYTLLLSAAMGAAVLISTVFSLKAYSKGPVSISILMISSMVMVFSSLAGPVFWGETVSVLQILGILLSVASMALLIKPSGTGRVSFGWLCAVLLAGIGGGMQGPIQKLLATSPCAAETNEFITFSFFFSALASLLLLLFSAKNKQERVTYRMDRKIFLLFAFQALLSVFLNINNLKLVAELPTVVFFPVYSIGGLLVSTIASLILFHEKISGRQIAGLAAGLAALFLISGITG